MYQKIIAASFIRPAELSTSFLNKSCRLEYFSISPLTDNIVLPFCEYHNTSQDP